MSHHQDTLKSQTMKFDLLSKNVLTLEEAELYELANLAGVIIDQKVFKIIMDLVKMNVTPAAIIQMLKHMRNQDKVHTSKETHLRPKQHMSKHVKSDTDLPHSARSDVISRPRGHSASAKSGSRSARS